MAKLPYNPHKLFWMGDSLDVISTFPPDARRQLGFGVRQVQNGLTPPFAKRLKTFGKDVYELISNDHGNTYRVAYLIKMKKGSYGLDAFMKKSKKGIGIPQEDKARILARLKRAIEQDEE